MKNFIENNNHWYDKHGNPQHEKTLRDARKEGLFPSVTKILSIGNNVGLNAWKQQNVLTTVIEEREHFWKFTDEELKPYIVEKIKAKSNKITDFGHTIHNLVNRYLNGETPDLSQYDHFTQTQAERLFCWCDCELREIWSTEESRSNIDLEYGGTLDCVAFSHNDELILIDWKTQKTEPNKRIKKHKSYIRQLSAYVNLLPIFPDRILNVVVSSTEEGRMEVIEWKRKDVVKNFNIFMVARKLFKEINGV